MISRILFFGALLCATAFIPVWLYVSAAVLYALFYTGYELIILGACIDSYYGFSGVTFLPYYTICTAIGLLLIEWVKPHISVYNQ